jgi:hypothetical protein
LPDSVGLSTGIQYLWKVEAQIGPGRSVSSELVSFTLKGSRPDLLHSILCAFAVSLQTTAADSLRLLSPELPETVLTLKARERPHVMREAISNEVARALRDPATREEALASARRMASAMATAWSDSFLVRRVDRIAVLPPSERIVQGRADSLRRAGATAFSQRGPAAAIRIWQRALSDYRTVPRHRRHGSDIRQYRCRSHRAGPSR